MREFVVKGQLLGGSTRSPNLTLKASWQLKHPTGEWPFLADSGGSPLFPKAADGENAVRRSSARQENSPTGSFLSSWSAGLNTKQP